MNTRPDIVNNLELDILLTDFGLSVIQDANSRQFASTRAGVFRTPEQLDPVKYDVRSKRGRPTAQSDIFSFASLCYTVCI